MRLTPNFHLDELTLSDTGERLGLDNTPSPEVVDNLKRLASMLEEIRAIEGRPIIVSSGYRSEAVNRAVGGSKRSAHMSGLAADFNVVRKAPRDVALAIADTNLRFDQLIVEFDRWVHIGLADGRSQPRREILTARKVNGKTVYLKGIV
jgi:hypothetical protein